MPKLALQSSLDDLPKLKISDYQKQTRLRLATTATACNYGGYRKWFVCKCGRRASVFYFSRYWQCRHCVGLQLSYWDWINQSHMIQIKIL